MNSRAYLVQGMAWGDESKGQTVAKLCEELPVDTIVRFCGGAQAAHHVVLGDGSYHCFSQFGSGMIANQKVKTHLSRFMLVEPFSMMREAAALEKLTSNPWKRTTVDRDAVIVTPIHRMLNRLRERSRGENRHGSCGRGIGAARELQLKHGQSVLMAKDLQYLSRTIDKLEFILSEVKEEMLSLIDYANTDFSMPTTYDIRTMALQYQTWPAEIVDSLRPSGNMVFEGAQGVLLDEKHGTAPHTTWTNTTFGNADTLLDELGITDRYRIGCLRTYHTRHGAGPFPTEDNTLDLPELHNGTGEFQGAFRVGHFDSVLAKKAIGIVGGVDGLAISHIDYLPRLGWRREEEFFETISHLDTPVVMKANGPTSAHREITLERICAYA